ncbi:MAG: hypothetical protein A2170_07195 [Deltaproteobacteria bacterium RBG_13_53_10]|nr:MAG: hypothetical protein A2170_07195 [Deltaproteobacteria bacterium RBG_13_53_10]
MTLSISLTSSEVILSNTTSSLGRISQNTTEYRREAKPFKKSVWGVVHHFDHKHILCQPNAYKNSHFQTVILFWKEPYVWARQIFNFDTSFEEG